MALALLRELQRSRRLERRGLTHAELSESLRTDPLQTEPILETLIGLDWVGRLDEPGEARYVLLCDPAATPAEPLIVALLVQPMATLRAFWQRAGFAEMTLDELISR